MQLELLQKDTIHGSSWPKAFEAAIGHGAALVKLLGASSYSTEPVGTDDAPAYLVQVWRHGPVYLSDLP